MKTTKILLVLLAVILVTSSLAAQDYTKLATYLNQAKGDYVGAASCSVCHLEIYDWWFGSGHAHKLRSADEARGAGIPHPDGITWDEIWKVIGGHGWKARFIKQDGYIYTAGGKNQFNLATKAWSDYHKDETTPYKCGPCHMTNYSPNGNQDYKPGAIGTWTFDSIECEECHGPGKQHILTGGSTAEITVDRTSSMCGDCHFRTDPNIIPASGGFIKHHEQYNEILKSGHGEKLTCNTCHDPHKTSGTSIKITCEDCHADVLAVYKDSSMAQAGIKCVDCHMAYMTKSAVSEYRWRGDVKTHIFKIDVSANAQAFNATGSEATGIMTSEFTCLVCHYDRDKAWAAGYKGSVHGIR